MKNIKLVAIILPLFILLGWVIQLQYKVLNGFSVRLKIAGYDPRDLLSGHYLRYNIDFGNHLSCPAEGKSSCICLTKKENEKFYTAQLVEECSYLKTNCQIILNGFCNYGTFSTNLNRFYIPEEYSPLLQRLPENGSIEVSIDSEGNGIVKEMYVDDTTILDYAKSLSFTK